MVTNKYDCYSLIHPKNSHKKLRGPANEISHYPLKDYTHFHISLRPLIGSLEVTPLAVKLLGNRLYMDRVWLKTPIKNFK